METNGIFPFVWYNQMQPENRLHLIEVAQQPRHKKTQPENRLHLIEVAQQPRHKKAQPENRLHLIEVAQQPRHKKAQPENRLHTITFLRSSDVIYTPSCSHGIQPSGWFQ